MKRRTAAPAAAAALAAGLLLTACSSDSSSEDDGLAGIDAGTEPSDEPDDAEEDATEPEPEPEDDGIERPEIILPDDMVNTFEDTETGDPVKDAILGDVVAWINAVDMAIAESDPEHESVAFYATDDGLFSAQRYIRGGADNNRSWAGEAVYYSFTVNNEERQSKEPIVSYCVDITQLRTKELGTGDVLPKSDDAVNFHYEQRAVRQNEQGVWQVYVTLPRDEAADQACVR